MEIKKKKSFCTKHSFYYSGRNCPFCERERIDGYVRRFKPVSDEELNREPSAEELLSLVEKFNELKIN